MAPSVTGDTSNGVDKSLDNGSVGYKVKNIVLNDPANKKLRIVTIGGGVSGIMMAYKIQKDMKNVEHTLYEKNADIGGTWFLNRYPGCACDIPSHAYTYNFALNPDWPKYFSSSQDIWTYLDKVCKTWDLRRYMQFDSEIIKCEWNEDRAKWAVHVRQTAPDGTTKDIVDECDILNQATGVLNNYKWPKIKGLDLFKGKILHTARWDAEYQAEQWKNDSVGVIGSGASSIQTVAVMQPHAKHMDIFIRTPVWFVEIGGNNGKNIEYTPEEKAKFRSDPSTLVSYAKNLEGSVNGVWDIFLAGTKMGKDVKEYYVNRTKEKIRDPVIAEKMIPKWAVGCRRITPGDPYMEAIQQANVDVHFTEVVEIFDKGLIGKDGTRKEVDTIICATGFDTSFRPSFPIIGKNGVNLQDKWGKCPDGYLGLGVPEMPNFFTFIGPAWPIGNGSVMGPLEKVGDYVIQFLQKIQGEQIRSFEPKQDITDAFNEHVQEFMQGTVWMDDCRSWYKDPDTNRVNALWPGSSLHYIEIVKSPRYEDFTIKYENKNPWAFMGRGDTLIGLKEGADRAPYINLGEIDTKWLQAANIPTKIVAVGAAEATA